ncbi:MAG: DNA topoisomerase (ATP-hydrolyzing) [Clostridia bacterium]
MDNHDNEKKTKQEKELPTQFSIEDLRRQIDQTIKETSNMIKDHKTLEELETGKSIPKPKISKPKAEQISGDVFAEKNESEKVFISKEENKVSTEPKKQRFSDKIEIKYGIAIKSLEQVLHESMIPYTEHVVMERALPRVEDGLKPVQRRILFTMLELNLEPDKAFRKSARIVGDCMGKYHPHGDSSVYDAMVRMAQDYNMGATLVHGHGNFGSIDGDSAAAMRYTEAKLTPLAMEILRDLEKNTVPWQLNFDDTIKEPMLLPAKFPNLLVNGANGIAVGVATNIPTHNLSEVIDGVVSYIANPDITLESMMRIIPAPDFPTGGTIIAGEELEQAYRTGKGRIVERANFHIENQGDKLCIVITEMPYQTNKAQLLQKIAELEQEGKGALSQIQEIRDESDRNGMRAVIRLKKECDVKAVVESLLKYTGLQTSFAINMVAIADGKPRQMGLIELISYYTEFQRGVVLSRSKFDLNEATTRAHIIQGLIIAIKNIDEVIAIIKSSSSVFEAKQNLKSRFILSEAQAQAILDMRLARLTNLEVKKLEEEFDDLQIKIAHLKEIVASKRMQLNIVREELLEIKKKFGEKRKSKIVYSFDLDESIESGESTVESKPIYLGITALGTIKKMQPKSYTMAQRELCEGSDLSEIHLAILDTTTDSNVYVFTKLGLCLKLNFEKLNDMKWRDKGVSLKDLDSSVTGEDIAVSFVTIADEDLQKNIVFLTHNGLIKKSPVSEYQMKKSCIQAIKLKKDDYVLDVSLEKSGFDALIVSSGGMAVRFETADVPLQNRVSSGVKAITLEQKETCIFGSLADNDTNVALLTNRAFAKKFAVSELEKMTRGRKGSRVIKFEDNGTSLIFACKADNNHSLAMQSAGKFEGREFSKIAFESRLSKGKQISREKIVSSFVFSK